MGRPAELHRGTAAVIPIVGPELLLVATGPRPRLLLDWVAEKLAARLNVNISELPQPYTLKRRGLLVPLGARTP